MMLCVARLKRTGFTLIEIMIVIAIIAILAGIAIPSIRQARAEAQLAGCRQNIMAIVKAIELATVRQSFGELVAKARGDSGYTTVTDITGLSDYLLENGYLTSQPRCPAASSTTRASGSYYIEGVRSEDTTSMYGGGCHIACCTKAGSSYGHIVGNQRIRPIYTMWGGRTYSPSSAYPEGRGNVGWADGVWSL